MLHVRGLLMSDELRHVPARRTSSGKAERRLPMFEDAGVDVAHKFVKGERIDDNVPWERAEEYDALAQEMIELYIE